MVIKEQNKAMEVCLTILLKVLDSLKCLYLTVEELQYVTLFQDTSSPLEAYKLKQLEQVKFI